jgi:hypothetical protein
MASKLLRTGLAPDFSVISEFGIPFLVLKTDRRGSFSTASYTYVMSIPSIFRAPETQAFIDAWRQYFGSALPSSYIVSSGGYVRAPLSTQDLLHLADRTLIRLLHHYQAYMGYTEWVEDRLVGGREALRWVLLEGASLNPERFLRLFSTMVETGLSHNYACAVIEGVASHLLYRFGALHPPEGWKPVEPVPEGKPLATALLDLVEHYPFIWPCESTLNLTVKACCHVLDDTDAAERLSFFLCRLLRSSSPSGDEEEVVDEDGLVSLSLNSIRGRAADSASH